MVGIHFGMSDMPELLHCCLHLEEISGLNCYYIKIRVALSVFTEIIKPFILMKERFLVEFMVCQYTVDT